MLQVDPPEMFASCGFVFNASENAGKDNALNRFTLALAGCVFRSLLLRNQQVAGSNPATSSKKVWYISYVAHLFQSK